MIRRNSDKRRAALAVEMAVVLPVLLFLLLMLIVGGIGVFRYQQVACLAREGARWGSVPTRQLGRWTPARLRPPSKRFFQNAVLPLAVGHGCERRSRSEAELIEPVRRGPASTPWRQLAEEPADPGKDDESGSHESHSHHDQLFMVPRRADPGNLEYEQRE